MLQESEEQHTDEGPGGSQDGFHQCPGLQGLCFGSTGKFPEQPETGVIHVAQHNRAARDTDRAASCAPE